MLMRLFTSIFSGSAFTLRIPALIGAALFIAAVYCLVRMVSHRVVLQLALFVSLACSPFVMDYLVAARGYGLASAFLLWMVVIAGRHHALDLQLRLTEKRRTCMLVSVCAALCLCANFAFAVVDALTALGCFLWICSEQPREYWKPLVWCTIPGLSVTFFFVGPVIWAWPKGEFTWGTNSLPKMLHSLVSASLFQPNAYLLNPWLHRCFSLVGTFLYPLLAALVTWRVVLLILGQRRSGERVGLLTAVAAICGGALLISLACHQALHLVYGIPLPLDRTAIWVALLFLVMAGALAAVPIDSALGRISEGGLVGILVLIACYNIGCLRLTYFNAWAYDADMKNVYAVLAYYNHNYGVTKVSTNWRYFSALSCYRKLSGRETFEEFPGPPSIVNYYPEGFDALVLYYPTDEDFCRRNGLEIVYLDDFTKVAVAIRRGLQGAHPYRN